MSKQKLIGIYSGPLKEDKWGINKAYVEYFSLHGQVILLSNNENHTLLPLDLLVLPGGADVYPMRYGQMPELFTQSPNIHAEYFDTVILPQYIKAGVPVFGICRGFQSLNVLLGGTLSQHIDQNYSTASRGELVDDQIIRKEDLFRFFGEGKNTEGELYTDRYEVLWNENTKKNQKYYKTNSIHHQGVYNYDLAESLRPIAVNKDFDNIEAFVSQDGQIAAVQWHPEEIWDFMSNLIIHKLLKI